MNIFIVDSYDNKAHNIRALILNIGDWSNGMIGVSKTFGGSSILSSPANLKVSQTLVYLVCETFGFCTKFIIQGYIMDVFCQNICLHEIHPMI